MAKLTAGIARTLRRRWRLLTILAVVLAGYALAGYLLLPYLAGQAAQRYVHDTLGRQLSIGALHVDPFRLRIEIDDLQLREADGAPLLGFRQLVVNADPLNSLFERSITLSELRLVGADVSAILAKDGTLNLAQLLPPSKEPETEQSSGPPPAVHIVALAIEDAGVRFEDRSRAQPFALELRPIRFALNDFRTQLNYENAYQFSAASSNGEQLNWSGDFTVQPLASSGSFSIDHLLLKTIDSYLQQQLPVRLASGALDLHGSYRVQLSPALDAQVELPSVRVSDLAIGDRQGAATPLRVKSIELSSLGLSLAQQRVQIAALQIDGAAVDVRRDKDGSLNLLKLLPPSPPADQTAHKAGQPPGKPEAAAPATPAADADKPWTIALAQLRLRDASINAEDRSVSPATRLKLAPLSLSVDGYSSDAAAVMDVAARTTIQASGQRDGQLQIDGKLRLQPLSTQLNVQLSDLALPIAQPYLAAATQAKLHSGQLSLQTQLDYSAQPATQLAVKAGVQLSGLRLSDPQRKEDVLRLKSLDVAGIAFHQNGAVAGKQADSALSIERIALREPYARVVINPDQSLNITQLLKPAGGAAAPTPAPAAANAKPASAGSATMPVRIKTVQIDAGSAYFADQSIEPRFAAGIKDLQGAVSGISTDPNARATIQLKGNVGPYAPVSISGSANLLAATQFCDLSLSFANMELSTFNPYSGKFAGYNIAKGKLSTELKYKINQRQLQAEHHVVIDQLEFGAATNSKDAAPLPIKLAAALLKDRNGVIDLQLPVRGSLDDPDFHYGALLWKVTFNLFSKLATAPFSALASLFGGGEELAYVDFPAGAAQPSAAEQQKLAKLTQALRERPQLKLEIPVTVAPEQDREAIAQQALDQRAPATAAGDDKARVRALEIVYRQVSRLPLQYPASVNSDAAKLAYLQPTLRAQLAPDLSALEQLARQRAQAVQSLLLGGGSEIDPARLFITTGGEPPGVDNGQVRMQLKLQ